MTVLAGKPDCIVNIVKFATCTSVIVISDCHAQQQWSRYILTLHRVCSGHALLVGVGGSGKQSLARLSGFICGYATYTIVISGNYNLNNFREDLQKMYKRAGVKVSKVTESAQLA